MFTLKMRFGKETKRTLRYEADEGAPITALYIQKSALRARPANIVVTVDDDEAANKVAVLKEKRRV